MSIIYIFSFFFFFNDTATTEIYTLSLHDALPISTVWHRAWVNSRRCRIRASTASRRSEEHTSELQSRQYLVCRLLLEKEKKYPPLHKSPTVHDISDPVTFILSPLTFTPNRGNVKFHPFFFTDTATTEIYTLSLHDALPICPSGRGRSSSRPRASCRRWCRTGPPSPRDRKSTRLNSSHANISYAVFCLK